MKCKECGWEGDTNRKRCPECLGDLE